MLWRRFVAHAKTAVVPLACGLRSLRQPEDVDVTVRLSVALNIGGEQIIHSGRGRCEPQKDMSSCICPMVPWYMNTVMLWSSISVGLYCLESTCITSTKTRPIIVSKTCVSSIEPNIRHSMLMIAE